VAMRKKQTDSEKQEKKCYICEVEGGLKEHIMTNTRIKIRIGAVLEEREMGEILKWMRVVKKLREIHRRGIKSVREYECG